MTIYQPATTDSTINGLRVARNAMRERLWADDHFAHRWMCHPGRPCKDSCEAAALPGRQELYQSEIEQ